MSRGHDPLLTLEEAGELLGTGPGLPQQLVADGHIDYVQVGADLQIRQSALIAYVIRETQPVDRTSPAPGHHSATTTRTDTA